MTRLPNAPARRRGRWHRGAAWALGALWPLATLSAAAQGRVASAPVAASNAAAATATALTTPTTATAAAPGYTFAWPLDATLPKPRGGSTRGAPVALDSAPSPAWLALRAPGLGSAERDRRAILAMAGSHRVSFDFLEVDRFGAVGPPLAPYQSWATEKVYVDKDEPGFVSLVHILEMRMVDAAGATGEPFVTKHWRQDWQYEPQAIVEYRGRDRWQRRAVGAAERRGAWLQTVHQVDESPRYASLGRWQHNASFSTWLSAETWRPLPRREWSVRDDYQVLLGTNRHTVGPTGWLQEENNLKAVLGAERTLDARHPYVGREYGVARYERLATGAGSDFAAADRYYEKTRAFWDGVTGAWSSAFARRGALTLRGPVDKLGLFVPLFERAERIENGTPVAGEGDAQDLGRLIEAMQAPP